MTIRFRHSDQNLLPLSSLKENQNTNSKKLSTWVCTTTSSNTELSGQDTHQNTTKPGIPPITSIMQTSQSGTSTPPTQASRTSIKLEELENGDVLVSVSETQNQEEAPPRPPKTATPQKNWGTTIGLPEMTATSPPYRSPSAWEEGARKQNEHDALHWTGCYNDNCWVHNSEKVARVWYPKKSSATRSGWNQIYETKAPAPEEDKAVRISKNQQRKARHSTKNWKECYNDKCPTHVRYKVDAGYYPQKEGTKKVLAHWHRYHRDPKFGVAKKASWRQDKRGRGAKKPSLILRPYTGRSGTVGRKGTMPKKRGRSPTEGSGPTSQDRGPPGRRARTSQDGGRIGIQPRKVEERGRQCQERKPGPRAPK